eukprot:CAMPEP_0180190982 /NCGR_PEP_ID=MMETSP0987-20121128/1183_1 /TAXON_ID=697907 /ORGANISM="non described non described, Strain CCMP2293" /LENGTH=97 /DNA_ID=CAMNT_0022145471 /DNA_START=2 /DNA_END=291 /DNA_ORIENTATION=+
MTFSTQPMYFSLYSLAHGPAVSSGSSPHGDEFLRAAGTSSGFTIFGRVMKGDGRPLLCLLESPRYPPRYSHASWRFVHILAPILSCQRGGPATSLPR